MSESIARKLQKEIRDNESMAQRLNSMRARINKKSDEENTRLQRKENSVGLPETPENDDQRQNERSDLFNYYILSRVKRIQEIHGQDFLRAAEHGNALLLMAHLDEKFGVNYRDPKSGETALHIVASSGARKALRVLIGTGKCNFLIRDRQGRLASEMAYLYGDDPVMARYLAMNENAQARKRGVVLTRRIAAEVPIRAGA